MVVEQLHEPLKVRADFEGGSVRPLQFRSRSRGVLLITRMNASWESREDRNRFLYFSVCVEGSSDVFQLCYRERDRTWWLDSVMMDA